MRMRLATRLQIGITQIYALITGYLSSHVQSITIKPKTLQIKNQFKLYINFDHIRLSALQPWISTSHKIFVVNGLTLIKHDNMSNEDIPKEDTLVFLFSFATLVHILLVTA